jgi:tetratricopeptide (TPR) repeat protein
MNEVAGTALQRGQVLLDLGRAREAETQFRTALAAEPNDATLHALLAQALLRQERYDQAEETSRSALAADPEHVLALSTLAASLAGQERYPEARDVVQRGLALAPEIAGLHFQEASLLLALKRPGDALDSVERGRRLDPESSAGAAAQAGVLFQLRRYNEADAAVDEALRLDPENPDAHRIQGMLALRRGGGSSAVRAHRAALRLDPTDDSSREGLSVALKSRNPLYGLLLRYGMWLDGLPNGLRVLMLLLPFLLTRLLRPFDGQTWATVLLIVVVAFVVLSWTIEPLMNCVLLLGRERHLVNRVTRQATYGFLAFAVAAVACAVYAAAGGPSRLLTVAFGLALWAMVTGTVQHRAPGQRKLMVGVLAAAAIAGAVAVVATLADTSAASAAAAIVLLGGIVATWFVAFAR